VIRDGKILSVSADATVPAGARVIDAAGAVVTPGLFATSSLLGAVEVGALGNDLTVDNPELGAAFDVQYALNPESILFPVARMGGLTSAIVTPQSAVRRRWRARRHPRA
jgi:imidazolonepropionase-like amidohydrolase